MPVNAKHWSDRGTNAGTDANGCIWYLKQKNDLVPFARSAFEGLDLGLTMPVNDFCQTAALMGELMQTDESGFKR